MTRLSEKYIAGFLDSDGSIQYSFRKPTRHEEDNDVRRLYVSLEFSQKTRNDEVLWLIQEAIGGKLYIDSDRGATKLSLFGRPAVMALSRITKYLVVKRHYAECVLSVANKIVSVKATKAWLKSERRTQCKLPNHPSRKWMAGYIDGDGCFFARLPKGRESAQVTLEATSSDYDDESIRLIQKAFGGSIRRWSTKTSNLACLTITLPPSKARQMLEYFGKYLIVKKTQGDFIKGCAEMGHYRDGKSISAILKQLKAQPHRLSESSPVPSFLSEVQNVSQSKISERRRKMMAYARACKTGQATVG